MSRKKKGGLSRPRQHRLANKNQQDSESKTTVVSRQELFSGPLPPPSVLEGYNSVVPGAAERIIKMAEVQAGHRQSLETRVISGNIRAQARGQYLAFVLALAALGSATYLIATGQSIAGFTIIALDALGLAAAFVVGKYFQSRQLDKRRQELT